VLTLSSRIALWEGFLPHWVAWMREAAPDVSLRLEIGFEADIMQGLIEGTVDVGVMYTPTSRSGLVVEALFDETLVLVTSDRKRGWPDPGYIHIDWGPEFHAQFSEHFADIGPPALVANIGWLGVQQLLAYGGSGYFPLRLVRHHIEGDAAPQEINDQFCVFRTSSNSRNYDDYVQPITLEKPLGT
jgi:DNA-binding transcriptional LysR family regulator